MNAPPATFNAADYALFLDIDGTLVEFAAEPGLVEIDSPLLETLQFLQRTLNGALALVSGRGLADIDSLFGSERFPAAGAHGSELRHADGQRDDPTAVPFPGILRDWAERFVSSSDGLLLEHKTTGLSLHYRGAPERHAEVREFADSVLSELGASHRMIAGKMVYEIAPRHHNKGEAIVQLMTREPFAGRRPIFLGDDITDEDGFSAVIERNGVAILVGQREATAAQFSLQDVTAVRHWLAGAFKASASQEH